MELFIGVTSFAGSVGSRSRSLRFLSSFGPRRHPKVPFFWHVCPSATTRAAPVDRAGERRVVARVRESVPRARLGVWQSVV
ncbi:hypothetical protein GCM10022206_74710 [Streptomyces chiangmaiensis]